MWCRLILFAAIPDNAVLGLALALAIGVVALVVWSVLGHRRSKPVPVIDVHGFTWFVEGEEASGPRCDGCQVRLMARPLASRADGVAQFELCCPACGKVPVHRGFTLVELVELEQMADQVGASRSTEIKTFPSLP